MAYIPKGNSAWLLRKAINRSDSAIADLQTNLTTLARTASNTGTSTTTQVLFNDAGIVNGDAGLVYDKTTDALSVGGALGVTGAATLASTLAVTGATTLTGAATVQGLTLGKGNNAISNNTAFGSSALAAVTTAVSATAFGYQALDALTLGDRNTAFGESSLGSCTIGASNTGLGKSSLFALVSGLENTAVGDIALGSTTGSYNTAVARSSLLNLVAGNNNTAIGWSAGSNQTAGSNNGFFGNSAQADSFTGDNQYNYGNSSVATHKFRAGDVVVGTGNVVMSTIGKGIDFSATAGIGTSELLNDYEEGTWVPSYGVHVNLTSVVSVSARYTKVGRLVTISGEVSATVTTPNILTYFALGSLPFLNGTTSVGAVLQDGSIKFGSLMIWNGSILGYYPAVLAIVSGATTFNYNVTYSV